MIVMKKAVITVADNMSNETYKLLVDGIIKKFGNDIEFSKITDNSVIGGFVLNIDGTVFDLSISTQLSELEKHIKD